MVRTLINNLTQHVYMQLNSRISMIASQYLIGRVSIPFASLFAAITFGVFAAPVIAQTTTPALVKSTTAAEVKPATPASTPTPASTSTPATPKSVNSPVAATSGTTSALPIDAPRFLIVPSRETTLVAQMVGRIERMPTQIGASFNQGQTLIQFDCSEQDARIKMAQAEYVSSKEGYDSKVRLKALEAAGDIEVQQAASQAERARGQVELVRSQLKLCKVPAPFSGRVVKLHVREFQSTSVGQPMMDVVSLGSQKIRLNVPSKWLSWLKVGTQFQIVIDENGKTYPAKVSALNGRIDAVSQSIEIEGMITKGDASLLIGMSGSARFAQAQ
jgi:membrane fusion protein, multidrug efflux system